MSEVNLCAHFAHTIGQQACLSESKYAKMNACPKSKLGETSGVLIFVRCALNLV